MRGDVDEAKPVTSVMPRSSLIRNRLILLNKKCEINIVKSKPKGTKRLQEDHLAAPSEVQSSGLTISILNTEEMGKYSSEHCH